MPKETNAEKGKRIFETMVEIGVFRAELGDMFLPKEEMIFNPDYRAVNVYPLKEGPGYAWVVWHHIEGEDYSVPMDGEVSNTNVLQDACIMAIRCMFYNVGK